MRAAEHERIGAPGDDAIEHRRQRRVGSRCVGVTVLDDLDEVRRHLAAHDDPGVRLLDRLHVFAAGAGSLGAEDRDPPATGRAGGCLRSGRDHTDDGDVEPLACGVKVAAVAVLQAITTSLVSIATSISMMSSARVRTCSCGRGP